MKDTIKNVALTVAVLIIFMVAIYGLFFLVLALDTDDSYERASGWSFEDEEFLQKYYEIYTSKIEELKEKYDIECESLEKFGRDEDQQIERFHFYLYNDEFTVTINFNNQSRFATYDIALYCFEAEDKSLSDYEWQRNLVGFINEFTHFVAFDTRIEENQNHFEKLYLQLVEEERHGQSYIYHFDDIVGDVGYSVELFKTNNSYYYKMQKNSDIETKSNIFSFSGLLKPQ